MPLKLSLQGSPLQQAMDVEKAGWILLHDLWDGWTQSPDRILAENRLGPPASCNEALVLWIVCLSVFPVFPPLTWLLYEKKEKAILMSLHLFGAWRCLPPNHWISSLCFLYSRKGVEEPFPHQGPSSSAAASGESHRGQSQSRQDIGGRAKTE